MEDGHQLSTATGGAPHGRWRQTVYVAGTMSMLALSLVASLALWVVLPWVLLGWSPALVTSGSMGPLVDPGDVVLVQRVDAEELGPNTVVLYERPETGRILHRIVEVLPNRTFQTRGDANPEPDTLPVQVSDIRGAAVLAVPWIGRPSLWLQEGRPLPLAITAIALPVLLTLAPRAFDPAFDPWAASRRVTPAEILLRGPREDPAGRQADGRRLLPRALNDVILRRLDGHSRAAQHRTVELLEELS